MISSLDVSALVTIASHCSVHFGHPLPLLLCVPPLHFQSGQADCLCGNVCLKKERGKEDRRHRGRRNWGFLSTQGSVCFCNEVSYLLRFGALQIRSMCVIKPLFEFVVKVDLSDTLLIHDSCTNTLQRTSKGVKKQKTAAGLVICP